MFCFCSPCSPHTSVGPECMACVSRTSTHFNLLQAVLSRIMSIRIIRIVFEPLRRPPVITSTVFDPLNSANIFFVEADIFKQHSLSTQKTKSLTIILMMILDLESNRLFNGSHFSVPVLLLLRRRLYFLWLTSFKPSN